ncbi:SusD/RagB family nutrient-binding outer membrane lipoprotein [Mucilaginibacter sp. SP1R1]|uniref:SusD/RagB family nutrient-binding outer membrane lipoprotein n=1 Tax=Mucilaginibacter sp. SP1R1 TaxID=2723091 RepID=UPI00161CD5A1|nr:SusD/RagB family nutrient-binding outer membrane lipoprotein [Mucilaginibacter sp. SP1R1]MBB6149347.1 hypothetical protein [Mucilaginibacter sp. SP1R1]
MKKSYKYIIGLLAIAAMGQSCKKDFINVNTNPKALPDASPEYLFTGTTADIDNNTRNTVIERYQFMVYMQYIVPDGVNANLQGNFWAPGSATGPGPSLDYYNDYYTGVGVNMHRIIAKIDAMTADKKAGYANIRAICQIVDTYHAWRIADVYGAMPYSQAFDDTKYPNPAYDYDYTLYKTFDTQLKAAAAVLQTNAAGQVALGSQDFFYNGDVPSWLACANTLRIKIAQRYEKRDAANLAAVLADVHSTFSDKIIASNAQSFGYNNTQGNNNNVDDINAISTTYDASYAFVEFLKSTKDPRLPLLVRQNDFGTNSAVYNNVLTTGDADAKATLAKPENKIRYYGKHAFQASQDAAYGWTGAGRYQPFTTGATTTQLDFLSLIQGRYFVKNGGFKAQSDPLLHSDEIVADGNTIKMRRLFLTYAETCFMMAEIAQKGGTGLGKSATEWYNAGIQASFDQYTTVAAAIGVPRPDTVAVGDYMNRYPYNGTLERIYSQEWVHFMAQPEDAWAMWKRTGYPLFKNFSPGQPTTPGNIGDGSGNAYLETLNNGAQNMIVPRRTALNKSGNLNDANYYQAIQDMITKDAAYGPNANYTIGRIWWDKQ